MKLEKKHYYWIGGIIIAGILIYYFWDSISSTLGIGSNGRRIRAGMSSTICGTTRAQNIDTILSAMNGDKAQNTVVISSLSDSVLCDIVAAKPTNLSASKSKPCGHPNCSKFASCWRDPSTCCASWSEWWDCHGGSN